jgi:hypothetical protein
MKNKKRQLGQFPGSPAAHRAHDPLAQHARAATTTPAQWAWQPTASARPRVTAAEPAARRRCTADSGGVPAAAHRCGMRRCDVGHTEAARLVAHRGWSGRWQLMGRWRGFNDGLKKDGSGTTPVGLTTGECWHSGLASSDGAAGPARRGRRKW